MYQCCHYSHSLDKLALRATRWTGSIWLSINSFMVRHSNHDTLLCITLPDRPIWFNGDSAYGLYMLRSPFDSGCFRRWLQYNQLPSWTHLCPRNRIPWIHDPVGPLYRYSCTFLVHAYCNIPPYCEKLAARQRFFSEY